MGITTFVPQEQRKKSNRFEKDSTLSWLVLLASTIGVLLSSSFYVVNGIVYTYLMEEFGFELQALTWIGSVHLSVSLLGSLFTVRLVEMYGLRPIVMLSSLFLFGGCFLSSFFSDFILIFASLAIVYGIGASLCIVSLLIAIDRYFDKKKAIAMPLVTTGGSFANLICSPLINFLLERYNFVGGMKIYAALLLNVLVCGAIMYPLHGSDQDHTKTGQTSKDKKDKSMKFCLRPVFIVYLFVNLLYNAGLYIPSGLIPSTAVSRGVSKDDISLALSLGGITEIAGRLLFGYFAYIFSNHIRQLWSIFTFGFSATLIIIPFSSAFPHFLAYALINGLFRGGSNLGYNLVLKNIVAPQYFGRAIALALVFQGPGALLGSPLAAFISSVTQNDNAAYWFGAGLFFVASILLLPFKNVNTDQFEYQRI